MGVHSVTAHTDVPGDRALPADFWWYLTGRAVSTLGSTFTTFAVPLLVFRLTGSPQALGISVAATYAPYMLFGLVLGALVDRVDRKALMFRIDLIRAGLLLLIPLLYATGHLRVIHLYALSFLLTTLQVAFEAAKFAAVANLVPKPLLVTANSRLEMVNSVASVLGPTLAGALVAWAPVVVCFALDAASFVVAAGLLLVISTQFNESPSGSTQTTRSPSTEQRGVGERLRRVAHDAREGLRFVLTHPVLRPLTLMMCVVNLVDAAVLSQLVPFAKNRLAATDSQLAWLYTAQMLGVLAFAAAARRLRLRLSFLQVATAAMLAAEMATTVLGLLSSYLVALVLWGAVNGLRSIFNINSTSLRQQIVPDQLRGRVASVSAVLSLVLVPVGALLGGALATHVEVGRFYVAMGGVGILVIVAFLVGPLGAAMRWQPPPDQADAFAAGRRHGKAGDRAGHSAQSRRRGSTADSGSVADHEIELEPLREHPVRRVLQ